MLKPILWLASGGRHWGSHVNSGTIIGALSIWQGSGRYGRLSVYWMVAAGGLVVAFYRAWSEEHDARIKAENDRNASSKQQQNVEQLTQYIEQGQELLARCRTGKELVPSAEAE